MQKEAATEVAEAMEIKQDRTASDPGSTELLQTGRGISKPPSLQRGLCASGKEALPLTGHRLSA